MLNYNWHPQPTSLRLATLAAKKVGLESKVVLDPFCGTGACLVAAIRAHAKKAIGSDIEDWSQYLRPQLIKLLKYKTVDIELHWHIDAFDAIKRFDHDILFCDPPGPFEYVGGCLPSLKRDIGLSGNELKKYWRERLKPENWIAKKHIAIANIAKLFKHELEHEKRVIANLFVQDKSKGPNRDLKRILAPLFDIEPLGIGNWCEVRLKEVSE